MGCPASGARKARLCGVQCKGRVGKTTKKDIGNLGRLRRLLCGIWVAPYVLPKTNSCSLACLFASAQSVMSNGENGLEGSCCAWRRSSGCFLEVLLKLLQDRHLSMRPHGSGKVWVGKLKDDGCAGPSSRLLHEDHAAARHGGRRRKGQVLRRMHPASHGTLQQCGRISPPPQTSWSSPDAYDGAPITRKTNPASATTRTTHKLLTPLSLMISPLLRQSFLLSSEQISHVLPPKVGRLPFTASTLAKLGQPTSRTVFMFSIQTASTGPS